jgi:hypothetical protein
MSTRSRAHTQPPVRRSRRGRLRSVARTVPVAILAVLLAACDPTATASPGPAGGPPAPYVSNHPDLSVTLDHPITRKNHYPPGTWSKDSPEHERWEFCFDETSGSWSCIPVTAEDYQRYNIGDRVTLRQEAGQLAVIGSP